MKVGSKSYLKLTGLIYLLIAITGGFSIAYMPNEIFVSGDGMMTTQNIIDNIDLFRLGIVGDIFVLIFEIILTVLLYRLFKVVSSTIAMVATFARFAMSIIMGINLVNYLVPLLILEKTDYLNGLQANEIDSIILLFMEAHKFGEYIWQLFFALHLIALGYLIFKSKYFPCFLGILMMVGSIGYASDSMIKLLLISNEMVSIANIVLLVIAVFGELAFTFWLLIKKINFRNPNINQIKTT
ncbi:DUF4386 domain-containing protein [uncultured Psychroserpens sp.]|uniref:DUF4386 domain-containing protein n=1 Tax=uncultured Psychroserpens sp. TaxID=255436 RepID=UPI0026211C7B|nr:DUF4386 domain-containing protein [uncultured Psychroserpens sp.]